MEKYYLVTMLVNTAEQDAPSINVYPTKEKALIAYHNSLAAFYNADDVLYAIVKIEDGFDHTLTSETVDNRYRIAPSEENE